MSVIADILFNTAPIELSINLTGHINKDAEILRLEKKISKITRDLEKILSKTTNPNYQDKVPHNLKERDNALLTQLKADKQQLCDYLEVLNSL